MCVCVQHFADIQVYISSIVEAVFVAGTDFNLPSFPVAQEITVTLCGIKKDVKDERKEGQACPQSRRLTS